MTNEQYPFNGNGGVGIYYIVIRFQMLNQEGEDRQELVLCKLFKSKSLRISNLKAIALQRRNNLPGFGRYTGI